MSKSFVSDRLLYSPDDSTDWPAHLTGFRREAGEVPCPVGFSTQRSGRCPQCRPPMGLASGSRGARRKSMPEHLRRRATKRSAATPIGPEGCGGMAPSSSLPLLGDGGTSPSSRRLESGTMAHATDDAGGPGRASRARSAYLRYVTARLRRLCLPAISAWPMGSPQGEPSATLRCCRRGEHPEARTHRWVRCIAGRSRKLVRYAG